MKQQQKQNNKFTYFIIGTIAFSQGIMGLSDLAIQFMQKDDYKYEPAQAAFVGGLISLPWVIKPIWGIMTDTVPLFGYRRKSYLMLFGILGFLMWNIMATFGINNPDLGVSLLLGINICIAFCNVIGEALLVELSGQTQDEEAENVELDPEKKASSNASASQNVTFFFGMRSVGTFITAYFSGALLELLDKKYIFIITSIFPLMLALVSFCLTEKKYNSKDVDADIVKTGETLSEFGQFVTQPAIYKPILLIFAFMASPSVSTAMFYFYTNVLEFKPEFIGELRLMYACSSIMAVFMFNQFLKNVRFAKVFTFSTIIYCCISCLTIILVTRKNVQWGIPDKIFCMGDGVLDQVVGELNTMPLLVLACKMCPKNIEGTMYALLMSTINLGSMIAGQIGAIITFEFGVTDENFDNLPFLILLTSLSALLPLPFIGIIKEEDLEKAKEATQQRKLKERQMKSAIINKEADEDEVVGLLADSPDQDDQLKPEQEEQYKQQYQAEI